MFDVVVIGAGPAGSMCSKILSQLGHSVLLLEGHEQPGEQVNCSGIIGIEAFQHFNLPLHASIRTIEAFLFQSPGGKTLEYKHQTPLAIAVDRSKFDKAIAEKAVSSGTILRTGTRVTEIQSGEHSVTIRTQSGEYVKSKFAVIATGAGTPLLKQLGLGLPARHVLGAQAVCESRIEDVRVFLGQKYAPGNFAWAIPFNKGFAKVGLICQKQGVSSLLRLLAMLRSSGLIGNHDQIRCSMLPLSPLKKSFAHRTIVVGEAAGQLKTITCGGIYYGLLAAEIGAVVLHHALENKANPEALKDYDVRWKGLLGKELKIGHRFRKLCEQLSDSSIDALFEVANRDGILRMIRETANFDWHSNLISSIMRHSMIRAVLNPVACGKLLLSL